MEEEEEGQSPPPLQTLVIGNHCHDVIFRNNPNAPITQTLGGATSFLSNILDPLFPSPSLYISKVGPDFAFPIPHPPITIPSSPTTLFHSHPPSSPPSADRRLRLVRACAPILPSDLPPRPFRFGVAAAVAGEILPATLARMIDLCRVVFADAQGLIRVFDAEDGGVGLVPLRTSGFWELVGGIGFLKASEEEAEFVDVEEVRKVCCVVVTEGRRGCRVCWEGGEVRVGGFEAAEVDPTGAGDSFLGGFVVGLGWGLDVADAALLGNFFGALTVGQVGVPKFELRLLKVGWLVLVKFCFFDKYS